MSAVIKIIAIFVLCAAAYLTLWPVPVEPVAWQAPTTVGYQGDFAQNNKLDAYDALTLGELHGPEAAVVSADGTIYATSHEGWLVKWVPGSNRAEPWVDLGGRPLGLDFDQAGNLWVANAYLGLQKVTPAGQVSTEVTEVDGMKVLYADDVAVTQSGHVIFSDASTRFAPIDAGGTLEASLLDILEHSDNGRVLEYDPSSGAAKTLLAGLTFANGVALDPAGQFLLIAETGEYRVHKFWLTGSKAGQQEVIIDNLPGFPDNIATGLNGRFWVGITAPRSQVVDDLADKPFVRKMVQRLPAFMRPQAEHYGMVIAIDAAGEVLANLQSPAGHVFTTTGAAETGEFLFVTSLTAPFLAKYNKADLGLN